jgi:hypothetical protein
MMIIFFNRAQTQDLLIGEKDFFFFRLNPMDLKARRCVTISDYIDKCKNAATDFSAIQRELVRSMLREEKKIQEKLDASRNPGCDWIDLSLFMALPWKLACVKGKEYEDGLPHTRNDVIILPENHLQEEDPDLLDTLLHEQLHVYQKTYPAHFKNAYLDRHNWTLLEKVSTINNIRTNPDMDEWIYQKNGNVYRSFYNSTNPSGLLDVSFQPQNYHRYEHPNELSICDCLEITREIPSSSSSSSPPTKNKIT